MTPLERAARALCRLHGLDPDAHHQPESPDGVILDVAVEQPAWKQYRHWARAVLQAIREPSEGMIEAVGKIQLFAGGDIYGDGWVPPGQAPEVWQAMIDAALSEDDAS